MNITGKIIALFDIHEVNEKFKKREFVIEYAENPSYPEVIKLEFIQDKCTLLDPFKLGDQVTVEFNLKGRKWTDRNGKDIYFNTLQAWKIDETGSATQDTGNIPAQTEEPEWLSNSQENDDLPF